MAQIRVSVVMMRLQLASHDAVERNAFSVVNGLLKRISQRSEGFGNLVTEAVPSRIPKLFEGFGSLVTGTVSSRIPSLTALDGTKVVRSLRLSEPIQAAVSVPINAVCQRLIMQGYSGHATYTGVVMDIARTIIKSDAGFTAFYRGVGPRFFSTSAWGASMILNCKFLSIRAFSKGSKKGGRPKGPRKIKSMGKRARKGKYPCQHRNERRMSATALDNHYQADHKDVVNSKNKIKCACGAHFRNENEFNKHKNRKDDRKCPVIEGENRAKTEGRFIELERKKKRESELQKKATGPKK